MIKSIKNIDCDKFMDNAVVALFPLKIIKIKLIYIF